ncbi:DUF5689 domain-containing protein [Lutibacter sp. B1]|uniref:DUF5689 domain-containing protein n=1 Tax=Lutibacter sp. B1 TaxID=2725996 RepID=UPI00145770A8|nr:DUF5689 domain-containing protein [Lutibacter sp. B1]NLP57307.1 lamin tail domain-containing protein [Lutibacter sp. B1]
MKIYKTLKTTLNILLLITVFSCVKDDGFSTPKVECTEPLLTVTNTIQQAKELYTFGSPTVIDTDVIIEGYVVSSDESGNIYKSISIQDKPENPTSAIKIAIDQTDLYTKYNVGRKIYIKLKGLAVGYSYGSIQIGKVINGELTGISKFEVDDYIVRSCEVAEIVPKKVTISELNKEMLEMLIEIENVQFKANELGSSYANIDNTETVNRTLESTSENCEFLDEIDVRNSGYADFKSELLPEGKGSVIAVFSNYYNDFQLYLRSTEDVQFNESRCDYISIVEPNITIAEVKAMYSDTMVEFGVNNNYVVEGYVISSDENGNFEHKLVIQDAAENPSAGIQILIGTDAIFEQFNIGDKVLVKLDQLYMDKNEGVLAVGYPKNNKISEIEEEAISNFIFNTTESFEIIPTEISIDETSNPVYENILVTVNNVQLVQSELGSAFAFFSGTDDGFRTLETCGEPKKLKVFTNGNANFANELFPEGHGKITGVLSDVIEVRNVQDIDFDETFVECPVIVPKIMITEVADPKNSVSSRFVELYNAGTTKIDLTGWKLNKYINGSTTVSSNGVDLSGITINTGDFVIIANTGYAAMFTDVPEVETSYISGNGDDVYELVDAFGNSMDIYGVIGEDGTGTNWEYLDGGAVRNLEINEPNSEFDVSEWTVFSNANNLLINHPNTPKNAPDDYSPNLR